MLHANPARLAACLLTMLLVGCSGSVKTVTLKGKLRPPATEGLANPPTHPQVVGTALMVSNLSGTLAKQAAARVGTTDGDFSFELRTDNLPAGGDFVRLAWPNPTRGGVMLARTYSVAKDQTGELAGDLNDLSTLVTLGLESLRQTNPGTTVTAPLLLENQLVQASTLRSRFQSRYYEYLRGTDPAPGADADLAQDSAGLLFSK